jgi:hypothetical protein
MQECREKKRKEKNEGRGEEKKDLVIEREAFAERRLSLENVAFVELGHARLRLQDLGLLRVRRLQMEASVLRHHQLDLHLPVEVAVPGALETSHD